ncbi:unnamed protein product [Clonostachys byssicola]|uniref:Xylose isomerase-like TIM barrel domain-containing protein n=1 Tax=Clonostachys byssicola TaxID=160290 RepID=A0A9N9UMA2_9HYPO|nr:unnamed protein product [Clonostachys byssicola]
MPFKHRWAVASVSLGTHPSHTLECKIEALNKFGFDGIELVWSDLAQHAASRRQNMTESAKQIRDYADLHQITILSLNPFKFFEGNLGSGLDERLRQVREWCYIATVLNTQILQMPSQFLADSTGDEEIIVRELQEAADLAAQYGLSIAYEAVAWSPHNSRWQDAARIVESVARPNFGHCLDSFHIHAKLWGDARSADGKLPDADKVTNASLKELPGWFAKNKVMYIQLSDGARFDPPLKEDSPLMEGLEVKDYRLAWSRSARPFPLESPGYFPMENLVNCLFQEANWKGWISLEAFLKETKMQDNGPEEMAARARASVDAICRVVGA